MVAATDPAHGSPGSPSGHGRLPWLHPADLNLAQRAVYDAITEGGRETLSGMSPVASPDGRLEGPFNAMLVSPRLGGALQALGAAIRFESTLLPLQLELAILLIAADEQSEFEWLAHSALGAARGLTVRQLEQIRDGVHPTGLAVTDQAVADVVAEVIRNRDLTDALYDDAVARLGPTRVVELLTLVGYYQLLALNLRILRVPLPAPPEGG